MAHDRDKMTEEDLVAVIDIEKSKARDFISSSDVESNRELAIDYYQGEKFGTEKEGRSQYVSRDVQDTVEWIMPQIIDMVYGGNDILSFDPVKDSPEELNNVKLETKYITHLIMHKEKGFIRIHDWVKDALMVKNGFIKYSMDDEDRFRRINYKNLTRDQLDAVLLGDVELIEVEEIFDDEDENEEILFFNASVKEKYREGFSMEVIPPEELLVNEGATDIDDADFVVHEQPNVTISDLREMGYDIEDDDPLVFGSTESPFPSPEASARNNDLFIGNRDNIKDPSRREITLDNVWIKIDFDGDGISELRNVIKVGKKILANEEVSEVPVVSWSPIRLPHKFYGMSASDIVEDLQKLKSHLIRSMLDNITIQNHGKWKVIDGQVNLDDLLDSNPMSIIRTNFAGAIERLDTPSLPQEAFQMLGYIDSTREERTGVSKLSKGMDSKLLGSNTAVGAVSQVMTASMQRIMLIVRMFAETGLKELFMRVHKLVRTQENEKRIFTILGETLVANPTEFNERNSISVNVGAGNLSKDVKMFHLQSITQDVQSIISAGGLGSLVSEKNIFNLQSEKLRTMGIKNVGDFFTDPDTVQKQPPPPSPEELRFKSDMAKLEAQTQKDKLDFEVKQEELRVRKAEAAATLKKSELEEIRLKLEIEKARAEIELNRKELQIEREQKRAAKIGN